MKPAMPASAIPAKVYHGEQFPHSLGPKLSFVKLVGQGYLQETASSDFLKCRILEVNGLNPTCSTFAALQFVLISTLVGTRCRSSTHPLFVDAR
jgi:hypothetical protein